MSRSVRTYGAFNTRTTPPTEPILGESMVENHTGGFVYALDPFKTFERFLILGSEGGSYYVGEKKLTKEAAGNAIAVIERDGRRAVDLIVSVSEGGRALKNDPAIFALALAASAKDPKTRAYALVQLSKVCRIPTHLFHFLTYVKQFRGFGRGLKRAVSDWYSLRPTESLAYAMVKYQQRDGWSHADVLRLTHPKTTEPLRNALYRWAVDGFESAIEHAGNTGTVGDLIIPKIVSAFEEAKTSPSIRHLLFLIDNYNLSREMLPTESLKNPDVWGALLPKMKATALLRNLGNMSKVGLLTPLSDAAKTVVNKLSEREWLKEERVHPVSILIAMKQYETGHGLRGSGEWIPVPSVIDALDDAFYAAFETLEPTGKSFLFGVDVSGSMSSDIAGTNLSCAEGAAAMALACAKTERNFHIMGFANTFRDLGITPKMRLTDALKRTTDQNFGSTNCALPMEWALKQGAKVDVFVVITDNEVNYGQQHASQALRAYRQHSGIAAKQIVMGMSVSDFTIADPNDPLALDIAGFDASVPQAVQEFARL